MVMRYLRLVYFFLSCLLLTSCLARRDSLAPVITIYDPPSGATQGLEQPIVSGYALDDNGILSVKVNNTDLLETTVFQNQKGKKLVQFFFQIQRQSGEFVATLTAEDTNGNVTTLPYTLKIDTENPTVELSAERLSDSRLRISGVARDNDAVNIITVEGNPVPFLASPEQTFNVDVTASSTVTVVVEDRAGNSISQSVSP